MRDELCFNVEGEIEGRYTLRAVKKDGSGSRLLADFHNLILDNGLAFILGPGSSDPLQFVRVGAGSTPPSVDQSQLVSQIASSNSVQSQAVTFAAASPYWIRRTRTIRFATGVATGNIAEVGIGWSGSGDTLFSRELVRDSEGNPTTVVVEADEFLDVTYSATIYPSLVDGLSTLNLNGNSHAVTLRASLLGSSSSAPAGFFGVPVLTRDTGTGATLVSAGGISPITGQVTGAQTAVTNVVQPYVPGSGYGEVEIQLGLAQGNIGGISAMQISMLAFHPFQVSFDPPVPKTASQIFKFRLRINLARRDVT